MKREKKITSKKKDISTLQGKIEREGYTIVPIKLYFNKKVWQNRERLQKEKTI